MMLMCSSGETVYDTILTVFILFQGEIKSLMGNNVALECFKKIHSRIADNVLTKEKLP